MNNSGEAVAQAMNYYKIPIENVIVIFDDINIDPPRIRIKRKGSDGGHNGIKSIIALTGGDGFPRVKIGIGRKPRKDMSLTDWVLSRFTDKEKALVDESVNNAVLSAELLVQGRLDEAMNTYNRA
jgi:PTH1 family peptidyl-tRNA hydrolase